jgi:hypothetical protein
VESRVARRPGGHDVSSGSSRLTMLDPSIEVRPDDRFVDAGDVVTSAGVSAGIDMALYLVKRLRRWTPVAIGKKEAELAAVTSEVELERGSLDGVRRDLQIFGC